MIQNVEKFMNEADRNEELKSRLSVLIDKEKNLDKIIELAREYGYNLKAEDFKSPSEGELSLDDLDAVAGGGWFGQIKSALKKLSEMR